MDRATYDQLRNKIKAEYQANLDALNRVWEMAKSLPASNGAVKRDETPPPSDDVAVEPREIGAEKGFVMRAVTDVLPSMSGTFTWQDVLSELSRRHPSVQFNETSVRQAVKRLVELDTLKLAQQGQGRRPSLFRVK